MTRGVLTDSAFLSQLGHAQSMMIVMTTGFRLSHEIEDDQGKYMSEKRSL